MKYTPILTKDGKIQCVPLVIKNRDVLIGYIRAHTDLLSSISENDLLDLADENVLEMLTPDLDSSRFNGYIRDGMHVDNLTEEQFNQLRYEAEEAESTHPDDKNNVLDVGFFSVDCECGNFFRFNTPKEIPEDNLKCDLCDRTLIQYIHVDDEDIEIEGKKE